MKILAKNKRAFFDYEITEKLEAGLVLSGQEAKSAKTGGLTLHASFARISGEQAELLNAQIKPYKFAGPLPAYDPARTRRLLLHKAEINKLAGRTSEKGMTLLPLEAYVKKGRVKILLGLGRSKKKIDKRESIKKRETEIKIRRATRKIS